MLAQPRAAYSPTIVLSSAQIIGARNWSGRRQNNTAIVATTSDSASKIGPRIPVRRATAPSPLIEPPGSIAPLITWRRRPRKLAANRQGAGGQRK